MPYPKNDAKLADWCRNLQSHVETHQELWNIYDGQIVLALAVYTNFFRDVGGMFPIADWHLIKAQLWVESGATSSDWFTVPAQIGKYNDPGLNDLLNTPTGKLILPPQFANALHGGGAAHVGRLNVIAGIGYLLKRLALFGSVRSYVDSDVDVFGTTSRTATAADWGFASQLGQARQFQSSPKSMHRRVTYRTAVVGWRPLSLQYLAGPGYNGNGDGNYYGKLRFCYDYVRGLHPDANRPNPV